MDADLILVNPSSDSGRQFIRDWGQDQNKVVLDTAWVKHCIDTGRLFLAEEGYGGFRTLDDGLPIGQGDEDDSEEQKYVEILALS
jgi:hypothetical protein